MNYIKINKTLDDEHKQIFNSLYKAYNLCNTFVVNNANDYIIFKNLLLDGLLKIYSNAKKHWITEQRYFEDGLSMQPPLHKDVVDEIKNHQAAHTANLDKVKKFYDTIKKMEYSSQKNFLTNNYYIKNFILNIIDGIENHINTMDQPHFSHWVKRTGYE